MNAARTATTVIGARRRNTSEAHAAACRPSMAQASGPGWAGHHEEPTSVVAVSSSTKKTAIATSIARRCRRYHGSSLTPQTPIATSIAG